MLTARLFAMMFIQFFAWGAWYVTAPDVLRPLGFGPDDIGWLYSVGPIAGIIAPFFVGMIADRLFATERVLATLHLAGGGIMLATVSMLQGGTVSPTAVNLMFFCYMLCYFPTLSLTNTLAMHNITDSEKQFPIIRVGGTIGWILAGMALARFGWSDDLNMFRLAAYSGIALGLYSFALPHTPPPAKGQSFAAKDALGLDALVLLKNPSYLVFMVCSFLICIPLAFYYQLGFSTLRAAEVADPAFKMTFGQISEIVFMLLMPFFFKRLGVKKMLLVGMLMWVVRYALFAAGTPDHVTWMLLIGVTVHGICYDFFFVTGQIYTDQSAPKEIRGQAQGLLVLFTLGLGMLIGAQVAGRVEGYYTPAHESKALNDQAQVLLDSIDDNTTEEKQKAIEEEADGLKVQALQLKDWMGIWTIPAVASAIVLVIFLLTFKEEKKEPEKEPEVESESGSASPFGNDSSPGE